MAPFQKYTNLNLGMHSKWRPLLSLDTITHLYHNIGLWTQALFCRWIPLYILTTTAVKLDRRWISAWITHVDGVTYPCPNVDGGLTNLVKEAHDNERMINTQMLLRNLDVFGILMFWAWNIYIWWMSPHGHRKMGVTSNHLAWRQTFLDEGRFDKATLSLMRREGISPG